MYISYWHTNTHSTRDPKFATAIRTRDRHWNYLDLTNCYREGTNRTSHTHTHTHTHMRDITLSLPSSWDLRSSRLLHDVGWFVDVLGQHIGTNFKGQDVQERIFTLERWTDTTITNLRRAATEKSDVSYNLQMCHYSLKMGTIYSLTEMSKRRFYVAESGKK